MGRIASLRRALSVSRHAYAPQPGEPLDTAISRQRLLLEAYSGLYLPLKSVLFFSSLGFLMYPHVDWPYHLLWVLLILLMDSARAMVCLNVIKGIATLDLVTWRRRVVALDIAGGTLCGVGGALLMQRLPEINMIFFMGLMFVLAAVSLLVQKASRLGAAIFSVTTTLPVLLVWLAGHPHHVVVLSILTLIYWTVLFVASGFVADVVRQMMNIAQEREALVASLEAKNLEAKEAMAGALSAAHMRARVLSSASHDLRQPMHALTLYSAVLKSGHSPEQMREIVGKVDEVILSLTELLHRLLELSQLISNQTSLKTEPVQLDALVQEVSKPHEKQAREHGINWLSKLERIEVQGDATALRRVVDSLLENAVKFTESGHILVTLSQNPASGKVHFLVEDTGIGMSESEVPHVFEEYFQVRNQARNRRQGVGLGLAIAQRLCLLMKAGIEVESSPGKGSRFWVDFPSVMPAREPRADEKLNATEELDLLNRITEEPASGSDDRTGLNADDVCHESVRAHAEAMTRGPRAMTVLFLGMALLFVNHVPWTQYLAWALSTISVISAEAFYGRYTLNTLKRGMSPHPFHRMQCFAALLTSILTATGWWFLSPALPQQEIFLSSTILLLIPVVQVNWVLSSRRINVLGSLPILLTVCGSLAWQYPENAILIVVGAVIYELLVYSAATDIQRMLLKAVSWRRLREDAALALARSNTDIQNATERTAHEGRKRTLALAAASHDLRQPLHALSMCNATLSMRLSPEALLKVIRNVNNIVRSLGSLLHRLLDVSRSEQDALLIVPVNFDAQPVLNDLCEQMRPLFERKDLRLKCGVPSLQIHADPIALRRIVGNLLSNALKFTSKGSVTVTCREAELDGKQVALIEVRDSGKGIPEESREKVFEEFFQLDRSFQEPGGGIGLGLAIVRRLSRMMNGQVDVQAEPGGGSCFRVWLPLGDGPDKLAEAELRYAARPVTGLKVLVIDDDESVADSLKMLLEVWGFECCVASDGPSADAAVAAHGQPDVILADLRLPGTEQGAAIAHRLSTGSPPCPVLIITGETSGQAFDEALRRHYTVLQKPVNPDLLRQALHQILP